MDTIKQVSTDFLAKRQHLMAFIYWLVRDPHTAEDIFQEVWIKLLEALESGAAIEDQAKWCRGVAKNLILHHWRDQRDAKVLPDSELIEKVEIAFGEADDTDWTDRREALSQCLEQVPGKLRNLLSLKYELGHSIDGIAREANQSSASVIKALLRVRQALRQCIERRVKISAP
jgi:RNA polymerase sigma factor (sigma-70 family)